MGLAHTNAAPVSTMNSLRIVSSRWFLQRNVAGGSNRCCRKVVATEVWPMNDGHVIHAGGRAGELERLYHVGRAAPAPLTVPDGELVARLLRSLLRGLFGSFLGANAR